jgi:hypothetical protein
LKFRTFLGRNAAQSRHCERSEAIQRAIKILDCFVASLLAMTKPQTFNKYYVREKRVQ